MLNKGLIAAALVMAAWVPQAVAQTSVTADQLSCLPLAHNAVVWARVDNIAPETTVRLYFRRLHDMVEDFYFVKMTPVGQGRYWGVLPKPEDRQLDKHELENAVNDRWAAWWRAKELADDRDPNDDLDQDVIRQRASVGRGLHRHWLDKLSNDDFQRWLETLENEPVEYFVSLHDTAGRLLASSPVQVAEVVEPDECEVDLTEQQLGEASNLVVGETAPWQRDDERVFHWLCDGVVTRIDPFNVKRADAICRTCYPCEALFPTRSIRSGEIFSGGRSYRVSPSKF